MITLNTTEDALSLSAEYGCYENLKDFFDAILKKITENFLHTVMISDTLYHINQWLIEIIRELHRGYRVISDKTINQNEIDLRVIRGNGTTISLVPNNLYTALVGNEIPVSPFIAKEINKKNLYYEEVSNLVYEFRFPNLYSAAKSEIEKEIYFTCYDENFQSETEAKEWMLQYLKDESNLDNYRFAFAHVVEQVEEYKKTCVAGCCGFFDAKIRVAGQIAYIGCNYGH